MRKIKKHKSSIIWHKYIAGKQQSLESFQSMWLQSHVLNHHLTFVPGQGVEGGEGEGRTKKCYQAVNPNFIIQLTICTTFKCFCSFHV